MAKYAVADTGPLIALAKADLLRLLPEVIGQIMIPSQVEFELRARLGDDSRRLAVAIGNSIMVQAPNSPSSFEAEETHSLDLGEAQAVWLAHQQSVPLIIDEVKGRTAARRIGLSVVGTVGLLVLAKEIGLVGEVLPIMAGMRRNGYWLAQSLFERAASLANEPYP